MHGRLVYHWNTRLSSMVTVRRDQEQTVEQLADAEDSLIATSTTNVPVDVFPLSYEVSSSAVRLNAGVGVHFALLNQVEEGYFYEPSLSADNQSFLNSLTIYFFAPNLLLGVDANLSECSLPLRVRARTTIVPVYFYRAGQKLRVSPLVADDGTIEPSGFGGPFFETDLTLDAFRVVRIDFNAAVQRMSYARLALAADETGAYVFDVYQSRFRMSTVAVSASVKITLNSSVELLPGVEFGTDRTRDLAQNDGDWSEGSIRFVLGIEI